MAYNLLLFFHIFSATLSIGPFFILFVVIKRLRTCDHSERISYIEIFESTIRLVKHAGHALVITGILLLYTGGWSWHEPWIVMTLIVMFGSIFFLAGAFKHTLKKMHEGGCDHPLLIKKLQRSILIYIGLLMIMLWFMVAKPRFL